MQFYKKRIIINRLSIIDTLPSLEEIINMLN